MRTATALAQMPIRYLLTAMSRNGAQEHLTNVQFPMLNSHPKGEGQSDIHFG